MRRASPARIGGVASRATGIAGQTGAIAGESGWRAHWRFRGCDLSGPLV